MSTAHFRDDENSTLANICAAAASRYSEHADEFDKLAAVKTPPEGAMYPTGAAAGMLAEQFRKQAIEAKRFADIFGSAEPFKVEYFDDEEDVAA
jgi:hypothetical protein